MTDLTFTKVIAGALVGVGGYLLNCINSVLIVLAMLLIMDYIAGITLALMQGEFDARKGVRGVIKKLFYVFLVLLGFLLDYVITNTSKEIGIMLDTGGFFGIAVTVYLIGNEGLSIMDSLVGIGLPVPTFLQKAFGYIKDETGKAIKIPKREEV